MLSPPDSNTLPVYCALHRALTIDADLTDWAGVPFTSLTAANAASVLGTTAFTMDAATDNADLSGQFALQWDNQYLYIAGTLTDDARGLHVANQGYYQDDCFQMYFDGNHDRAVTYDADDLDLLIRVDNAAEQFDLASGTNAFGLDGGMLSATRDTGTAAGWAVEVAVPWSRLGGSAPVPGRVIGFDLIIDDDDADAGSAPNRKHYLIWAQNSVGACMEPFCSTVSLGDAVLTGAAP